MQAKYLTEITSCWSPEGYTKNTSHLSPQNRGEKKKKDFTCVKKSDQRTGERLAFRWLDSETAKKEDEAL